MDAKTRIVSHADRPQALEVVRAAFEQDLEAQLVERMWTDGSIIAECVTHADGRIVSYAAISPATIAFGSEAVPALALAPVAVAPESQRNGFGEQVVRATIDAAFARHPGRLMFVLGDPAYYRRFDFRPAAAVGYQWEGGDVGDAFQVRSKDRASAPGIMAAAGSDAERRSIVRYCNAFSIFRQETP